jgi:uncharacterized protein YueI
MTLEEEHSIRLQDSYQMTLGKDAHEYLGSFTECVTLKSSWSKSQEVKECYKWCEQHLGIKYKDWFMMNTTLYFKNSKKATFFRLTWNDLIA